jgi:branched-chain amino acid transport system substrate-binding protein
MRGVLVLLVVAAVAAAAACGADDDGERAADGPLAVPVSSAVCTPMTTSGGSGARYLIPLVGPMQNVISDHGIQNAQAAKLILDQHEWRAGRSGVALQICDEASAELYSDPDKCERIARALAANPSVLAVMGPSASTCARRMLPVLNRAPGGPVALLGIGSTYLGLTRDGPGVEDGDPDRLYPTGRRSYLRTVAADDAQAAAAVMVARDAGARRTFALDDGSTYGHGIARAFQEAAGRTGLVPVGSRAWDPDGSGYAALAAQVARARPDAVYLGGITGESNGPRLVRDLGRALGRGVALLAPDGFNQPTALVEGAGAHAEGLTISLAAAANRSLPRRGREWARRFTERWGAAPCCYAVHAGQVTELVLDALARADGDRASVLEALRASRVEDGLVGDFSFDEHGDSTVRSISMWRIEGGRLRFLRAVEVPEELLVRR